MQRWPFSFARFYRCAHFMEGANNPSHRTVRKRLIAGDRGFKRMAGQDSRHQPDGRAGIPGIEYFAWGFQPSQTSPVNRDRVTGFVQINSEGTQASQSTVTIAAGGKMADHRSA